MRRFLKKSKANFALESTKIKSISCNLHFYRDSKIEESAGKELLISAIDEIVEEIVSLENEKHPKHMCFGLGFLHRSFTLFGYLKPLITPEMLEKAVTTGIEKSVLKSK